jgi:glycosyltransferase involved in cell wall biosynthesis
MKLVAVGLRGIPGIQGGIETHAEHLYPLLAASGIDVTVVGRKGYGNSTDYNGVRVVALYAPSRQGLEAMVHTGIAVLWAFMHRADVVHVHAVGPGLWVPIARLLGMRVMFTHHGQDYRREKWGRFARFVLRLGERAAVKGANAVIVISREIQDVVYRQYGVRSNLVPNGVLPARHAPDLAVLEELGLAPSAYIISVGRLVPEKRHIDLVNAFARLRQSSPRYDDWRLVIVGSGDESSVCVKALRQAAAQTPGVVLAGFRSGDALAALLHNAAVFALPSSHEGLPIAMLEALSYGLPVVASDIEANLEVGLPKCCYARLGDYADLACALDIAAAPDKLSPDQRLERRRYVASQYAWDTVAAQTLEVLRSI